MDTEGVAKDQKVLDARPQEVAVKEITELSPEQKDELIQNIKDAYSRVYFARKTSLQNDLFLVAQGINPDTEEKFFDRVDGKIGQFFDAHGIAKSDQLAKLLEILEVGIDPTRSFSTAPFEVSNEMRAAGAAVGTAGGTAYKDGMAVLTSSCGKNLSQDGITHVFVNDIYADFKEPLSRLFPQYEVHLLSEQKQVMEAEHAKYTGA